MWEGDTSPLNERCKIFFTEENLGLVGEFRPPQLVRQNVVPRIKNLQHTMIRHNISTSVSNIILPTNICKLDFFMEDGINFLANSVWGYNFTSSILPPGTFTWLTANQGYSELFENSNLITNILHVIISAPVPNTLNIQYWMEV